MNAEVVFIKPPAVKELTNYSALLVPAPELWNEAWIFHHRVYVEVGRQAVKDRKRYVQKGMKCKRCWLKLTICDSFLFGDLTRQHFRYVSNSDPK
jgi:hypothetical protein